jgi:hypothetical protein
MPDLKIAWMPASEASFKQIRERAITAGKYSEFMQVHNEIVLILRDPNQAFEKGELLFRTRKPGGEVRLLVHDGISVCYAVYRNEMAGWVSKYIAMGKRFGE